ncbi:MAG: protease modulator HflC [Alphaproteobacteria bacterium]|nr:protease modulator HflC [Alphaproteobacteria bacterium]NCQ66249.1 protease modulator HflC [Alphaproteobacteria bacterium]NCT06597.1 protease modulator HflC [Alphaproteobacteria bacterium]
MKKIALPFFVIVGIAFLMVLSGTLFTVQQTERALVLQFGKIVRQYQEPGLKIKTPFVQDVIFFDNRLLHFNLPALEVNAADQKRLVVDLYVRYRITDVLTFYKTIGQDVRSVQNRLSGIVLDNMQEVIARFPLADMLSPKRSSIMEEIHDKVRMTSERFGIEVKDVRIIRADLPKENSEAIFTRMESERIQEAKQIRAEGDEQAQIIQSQADRDRTVLLAEATKTGNLLRGEGEALATKTYADAYNKDRYFYEIYRSLLAYKRTMKPQDTTIILDPKESDFLKHFWALKKEK